MRIGIFSDSINIPPKEGINVHTYNVALALGNQPGVSVVLIVCDRGWLPLDLLSQQPFETVVLPSKDFYNVGYIANLITDQSIDVLQTYMVYFAATVLGPASGRTRVPMCVEFHDLERTVAPLYGLSQSKVNYHNGLQRQAGQLASMVRVMSSYDYDWIISNWPELKVVTTCMPVSIADPRITRKHNQSKPTALFIGNCSYPPNAAAAQHIITALAPKLPQISFSLVGRNTDQSPTPENVHAYGMVPNIHSLLETHNVGLAPIFEGSGMKIKLLDYLSASIPVITTELGAHGYPKNPAIIIENDLLKWPLILTELLADSSALERLSIFARKLFIDNFCLENNVSKLAKSYRSLSYTPIKRIEEVKRLPVDQADIYWLSEIRETPRAPIARAYFSKGLAK